MSDTNQSLQQLLGNMQPANPMNDLLQGVNVPIKIQTPMGECRCYVTLPGEVLQNQQMLGNAIMALQNMGYQVDTWQPRNQYNNGGGNWNNQNGGGWNRGGNGGGWNRGGRW